MKKLIPNITFTVQIFQEDKTYIAHNPELDVSSCGDTLEQARENLKDALRGFMLSAQEMGTLDSLLEEAGYTQKGKKWATPRLLVMDRFSLAS
jgi:predicted RNase H-like HicB family nuclease